jgi:hypothetical protein
MERTISRSRWIKVDSAIIRLPSAAWRRDAASRRRDYFTKAFHLRSGRLCLLLEGLPILRLDGAADLIVPRTGCPLPLLAQPLQGDVQLSRRLAQICHVIPLSSNTV